MLYSTEVRLVILSQWFSDLSSLGCAGLPSQWKAICRKAGLAACLHSLSHGWDESEFETILSMLEDRFPILKQLHCQRFQEQNMEASQLRAVLRVFLWDFVTDETSQAAWLVSVMKRFVRGNSGDDISTSHQYSVLLSFMLGCTGTNTTTEFQQKVLDRLFTLPNMFLFGEELFTDNYTQAKEAFGDLGKALRVLDSQASMTDLGTTLYDLIDCMFKYPDWNRDNKAACLLFSSEAVVTQFINGLLKSNEKEEEGLEKIAEILVSMLVVCEKLGNRINQGLVNILDFAFTKLVETGMLRRKLIAVFWREIGERLEEDMGLDVLLQLGVHIGLKGNSKGGKKMSRSFLQIEE